MFFSSVKNRKVSLNSAYHMHKRIRLRFSSSVSCRTKQCAIRHDELRESCKAPEAFIQLRKRSGDLRLLGDHRVRRGRGPGKRRGSLGIATEQLWLLYLGYGVIGGIGLGIGYISPVSTLIKWFPDRPGLADL